MIRYFALCQGDILLTKEGSIPFGLEPPVPLNPWNIVTTLNMGGNEIKVIRLDKPVSETSRLQMVGLRKTHALLPPEDYALAGKAAELLYWDANTKFCGCCGSPTKWMTDISKKCPECGKEWWPSAATAVIVRVVKSLSDESPLPHGGGVGGEAILLVRARNFRSNHYGLVAGFLETGESLEEAVRREVREETGIEIKDLQYFGSQPWPYPFGLMVGFTAAYASGQLHLQHEELSEGAWFSRENMPPIPDKASIARRLIDDWLLRDVSATAE